MNKSKGRLATLMVAAAIAATAGTVRAQEIRYNIFDRPGAIPVVMMERFFDDLKKESNGAMSGRMFVGGQLLNGPATLKGIGDGVVGAGFVVPSLNQGELKHINVIPDLLPFAEKPWSAAMAGVETAVLDCEECRKEATAANVVWLGGLGPDPWHLMCRAPINSTSDLQGRKVRVTGASPTRLVRALGAVPVQLAPNEIATALQGGQIDCAFGPAAWLRDYALWDLVKTVVAEPVGIYGGLGSFVFNKRLYDGLSAEKKKILLDLIPKHVVNGTALYLESAESAIKQAKEKGVTFWTPDEQFRKTVQEFRKAEPTKLAADMRARGVKEPEKLIQLHLGNLESWREKLKTIGDDREKLTQALREQVYAPVMR